MLMSVIEVICIGPEIINLLSFLATYIESYVSNLVRWCITDYD
jgi:hypothetical protein